jgi:hypothetical protein
MAHGFLNRITPRKRSMATLTLPSPIVIGDDFATDKAVLIPGTPMRCKVMTITPEIAEALLAKNISNRPLDKDKVRTWLKEMQANRWKLTHQGIAFASDGTLVDGQHRLHAIIENGTTVEMLVFLDCDKDSFDVLDVGKKRSHNDILRLGGIHSPHKIAKLARLYGFTGDPREWDKGTVSPAELNEWAQPYKDILVTAASLQKKVVKAKRVLAMEAGAAMAIYQIYGGVSVETVFELFYEPMIDFHSDKDNPAWIFYQYVIRAQDERKSTAGPFWGSDRRDLSLPRARLWMQLIAIRDVLEGNPRTAYRWNPDTTMPDVRNVRSNQTLTPAL